MFPCKWRYLAQLAHYSKNSRQRGFASPCRSRLWLEPLEARNLLATGPFYQVLPGNPTANVGTVEQVTVNLENLSQGVDTGLSSFDGVFRFDPNVFSVSSISFQGSIIPTAWGPIATVIPAGTGSLDTGESTSEIKLSGSHDQPTDDLTGTSGGLLATLYLQVKGTAPSGTTTISVVVPPDSVTNTGDTSDAYAHQATGGVNDSYSLASGDQVNGQINATDLTPVTELSIPQNLTTTAGNTVTVPVNVSNPDPSGSSGTISADAAILFDPTYLSVAATGAVSAGTALPSGSGWNAAGYSLDTNPADNGGLDALGLHLTNSQSNSLTSTTAGSLWSVTFTVNSGVSGTTVLNLVPSAFFSSNQSTTFTNVSSANFNSGYTLSPPVTSANTDAVDGILAVDQPPAITSAGSATFNVGSADSFTVTDTGYPAPMLSETGTLPIGVTFNPATGVLSGTALAGAGGTYNMMFMANNGVGSPATQNFTLTVDQAPAITNGPPTSPTPAGAPYSFTYTASGFPIPAFSVTAGALPMGLTLSSAGAISGMPTVAGTFSGVVTALSAAGSTTQNFSITVQAGPANRLIVSAPSSTVAGTLINVTVTALDAFNNIAAGYQGTVALTSTDGQAAFIPTPYTFTGTDAGVHTFAGILKTAGNDTISATDSLNDLANQTIVVVTPAAAAQLVVTTQPSSTATAGVPFGTQPVVEEEDAYGNVIISDSTHTVTVARGSQGTALLQGSALTVTLNQGVATFSGLSYDVAETMNLSFSTNAGPYTVMSSNVLVAPGPATHLVVTTQPSSTATAGVPFGTQPVVKEEDAYGNVIISDSTHTVTAARGSQGTALLQGSALTVTLNQGVATFSGLSYNVAETMNLHFTTNASGVAAAPSTFIVVGPAPANSLIFGVAPSNAKAGAALSPAVTVKLEDAYGNLETGDSASSVSVTLASGPSGAIFAAGSVTSATASGGVATFGNLVLNTAGTYTLTFSDVTASSVPALTSSTITVSPNVASQLSMSVAPSNSTAGLAITPAVSVALEDAYGNVETSDNGSNLKVTVASGPNGATFTANSTTFVPVNAGVATFGNLVLNTAGNYTLSFSDASSASVPALTSSTITVSPSTASQLVFGAALGTSTAGVTLSPAVTVKLEDAYGNVETGNSASSISLSLASGPNGAAFANGSTTVAVVNAGVASFNHLTLNLAGTYTLQAADASSGGVSAAASSALVVQPNTASQLVFGAVPNTATAGVALTPAVTVNLEDAYGNIETGDNASSISLSLASGPSGATLAAGSVTSMKVSAGVAAFSNLVLDTAGNYTLQVTDTSTNGVSNAVSHLIVVNPNSANKLVYGTAPGNSTAGLALAPAVTVKVEDTYGNVETGDNASSVSVTLASGPSGATLTVGSTTSATVTAGVATFSNLVLDKAGTYTLQASVSTAPSVTSITSSTFTVAPEAANTLMVSGYPTSVMAGSNDSFTVIAQDSFGNVASGYTGTVTLSSTDLQATFTPASDTYTFAAGDAGSHVFSATLKTIGGQSLLVTDLANGLHGSETGITVSPGATSQFLVSAPTTQETTGSSFTFTVTATDAFGNLTPNYTGPVTLSSTDSKAAFTPSSDTYAFTLGDAGSHTFSAVLNTSGSQTIKATDSTNNFKGTSNAIAVRGLTVTTLTPTPTGFTVAFSKAFNPATVNLYNASSVDYTNASDVTLVNASGASIRGSMIVNATDTGFTFITTNLSTTGGSNGLLAAGTYTVTLLSGSAAFQDTTGAALDGNDDGIDGDNYVGTFTVTAPGVVVAVPDFARGPGQVINLPNSSSNGMPITLSNGSGVTDVTFVLQYNANLLSITGGTVNAALTGDTFTVTPSGSGSNAQATIVFHSPTALASGTVLLGGLTATVPSGAAYKSKQVLHFASVSLNGGALAATPDDGLQVVAYLGDTNGDGEYTSADSALLTRVNAHEDTGFAAFPVLDPTILGDLTGDGKITAADPAALNSYLAGVAVTTIPTYLGLPSNLPSGPDPSVTLPAVLAVSAAGTVVVPVNLDDPKPTGSTGLTEAQLALTYNPAEFSVTPQDVQLGSVPQAGTGWTLQTVVDATTGEIGITLYSVTPFASTASGSLVTITFQETATATPGVTPIALVASVDPNGQGVFTTMLDDNQGPLTLTPAPSNSKVVAGLESLVLLPATTTTAVGVRGPNREPPATLVGTQGSTTRPPVEAFADKGTVTIWELGQPALVADPAAAGINFWAQEVQRGRAEELAALDEYFRQMKSIAPWEAA